MGYVRATIDVMMEGVMAARVRFAFDMERLGPGREVAAAR